jgi:hypothetical protein
MTYTHKLRELIIGNLVAFVILKQKGNELGPQNWEKSCSLLPIATTLKILELESTLISIKHAINI